MKNYYRVALVMSLVLVSLTMVGCTSGIKIQSPPEDRKYLTSTPYDLEVVHTGCGSVVPDSLEAWLDKGEENEQDITSAFTSSDGKWTASDFELPLDSHTFTARANVVTGPWCMEGKTSDTRQFFVSEPTCVKGTVLGYFRGEDPSQAVPLPGATILVKLYGEIVGEGISDDDGFFCIDNVPVGFLVDVSISYKAGSDVARWSMERFDPGLTLNRSCLKQDCRDVCEGDPEECTEGVICVVIVQD